MLERVCEIILVDKEEEELGYEELLELRDKNSKYILF